MRGIALLEEPEVIENIVACLGGELNKLSGYEEPMKQRRKQPHDTTMEVGSKIWWIGTMTESGVLSGRFGSSSVESTNQRLDPLASQWRVWR